MAADWTTILWASSILTMTVGNVVAILQSNIKRMLAYSAIAHAGYILVGIVANSAAGYRAVIFYIIVYTAMNLGALSIVLSLSRQGDQRVNLEDYAGLGKTQPLPAAALSLFLISLAGIPLTGGFMGKFYLFSAAIHEGYVGLAIVGVLNSVLSVYYYFRLMVFMYMKEPQGAETRIHPADRAGGHRHRGDRSAVGGNLADVAPESCHLVPSFPYNNLYYERYSQEASG